MRTNVLNYVFGDEMVGKRTVLLLIDRMSSFHFQIKYQKYFFFLNFIHLFGFGGKFLKLFAK